MKKKTESQLSTAIFKSYGYLLAATSRSSS